MATSDEGMVAFPVDKLKAETLRAIAKDLNLRIGGKKEDVLKRIRTNSSSGELTETPTKRKAGDAEVPTPSSSGKRPRGAQSIKKIYKTRTAAVTSPAHARSTSLENDAAVESTAAVASPTSARSKSREDEAAVESTEAIEEALLIPVADGKPEVKAEISVGMPIVKDDQKIDHFNSPPAKMSTFDDYFVSQTTDAFIAACEILNLTAPDSNSDRITSSLRKPMSFFSDPKADLDSRLHFWLIPTTDGDIQNVTAFQEQYQDVLPKKGDSGWFEISISRHSVQGALEVKLLKGEMKVPPAVTPLESAVPETGSVWLSNPRPASQENIDILDQLVRPCA